MLVERRQIVPGQQA